MSSTRAQKQLEMIGNRVGISEAGKSFLTAAIDGFHDEPIQDLRGIPDGVNSNSIVQQVKATMTIRAPASAAGAQWDCHVESLPIIKPTFEDRGFNPFIKSYPLSNNDTNGILRDTSFPQTLPLGSIVANTNKSTVPATPIGVFGGTQAGQERAVLNPASNYTNGGYRIIAKAYEVISAGPTLYESGVVTIWGLPVANGQQTENYNVTGVDSTSASRGGPRNFLRLPVLPLTASECMLVPSAQQWKTKKGVYMVDRHNDPTVSTFAGSGVSGLVITETLGNDSVGGSYGTKVCYTTSQINTELVDFTTINPKYTTIALAPNGGDVEPMNCGGVFFSGLNEQDVLQVNVIWYIERFPDASNPDLLVLAKPTPSYDPHALEMYSIIMAQMPWGMIQEANGFGDWMRDAVETISDTIGPVLSALPGTAGMIGKIGTIGGKLLKGLPGGSNNKERVQQPSVYSANGRQPDFIEEVPRIKFVEKNSRPKKNNVVKKEANLLKKVSRALSNKPKKKKR